MNAVANPQVAVAHDESEPQIALSSDLHHAICQFLNREALLLDHRNFKLWAELLAEDLRYVAPVRITRNLVDAGRQFSTSTGHFDDDYASIKARVGRLLETKSAWSEDPASRTRRFITNVTVYDTDLPNEFDVISYLLVTRNRAEADTYKLLSAERHDRLRRDKNSFKLVKREILLDQAVLGMPNFAIFL
jgi:3-phenylpropionate/cinnamic acid dioxygenase small subunit